MYYVYLSIFGMLGALSRYALSIWLDSGDFPIATLSVNVLGCFLLAFLMQYIATVVSVPSNILPAVGSGFLGSFTTFSAFAFEASSFIQAGEYLFAGTYIFISLFGGLFACILGYRLSVFLLTQKRRRV